MNMTFISKFLPHLQWQKIKKLEDDADDVLELPDNFKAIRKDGQVIIVDYKKHKIVNTLKDTFPATPARAVFEIGKELGLFEEKKASKDIWTCGFRENEGRWVWYKNLEPQLTASFKEAYPQAKIDDKFYFYSARYGTNIIETIKNEGLKVVASKLNGLVLEHPHIKVLCKTCNITENYTIDDLIDDNKKANYDGHSIVCSNCGSIVKLS